MRHPRQEPKSGRQGSRLSGRSGFGQIQSPDKDVDLEFCSKLREIRKRGRTYRLVLHVGRAEKPQVEKLEIF